ncbi:hypothetical protein [Botrimarina sp.]|uniref:hypothetical protein n=1 Tax=Botrimarina sp. TaxID=2795802 RepID=UPI0032F04C60
MIQDALSGSGLAPLAVFGLLMFVAVFVGVAAWALGRPRQEVAGWSSLPLDDPKAVGDSRLPIVAPVAAGGCGKCENCSCTPAESPVTSPGH